MWTGCRQRAVYITRKRGGLADWTTTELVALLDSLSPSFSFQRLNLSFSGTCSIHTVLGLHTWTVAQCNLHCRAVFPKDLEWTTP